MGIILKEILHVINTYYTQINEAFHCRHEVDIVA